MNTETKSEGMDSMPAFRGDVAWIHLWEGHAGRPIQVAPDSGIRLDPGFDLGHDSPEVIELAFSSRLSSSQWQAVKEVLGKRGDDAKRALDTNRELRSIRILRTTAVQIFPLLLSPCWMSLCKRFAGLSEASTPDTVHTAVTSLAYNRGTSNPELDPLGSLIAEGNWLALADAIGAMQQNHRLEGIRRRRRAEGDLIRS